MLIEKEKNKINNKTIFLKKNLQISETYFYFFMLQKKLFR